MNSALEVAIEEFKEMVQLRSPFHISRRSGTVLNKTRLDGIPSQDYQLSSAGICGKISFSEITDSNCHRYLKDRLGYCFGDILIVRGGGENA